MYTFKLRKTNIACCLLCSGEAEYVFKKDLRNVFLSLVLVANFILLIFVILFAPSVLYTIVGFVFASVVSIFVKVIMHSELRCKKCRNIFYEEFNG